MKTKLFFPLILIAFMVACSPATKLEKSWMDPSVTPATTKPFKKVLVVAKLKDESSRRIAEDKVVKTVKAAEAVQSYSYLPAEVTEEQLTAKMKSDGFDGIIMMQLKEIEKSTTYNPGTTYAGGWYGGYRGGYRGGYGGVYGSPGYYSEDKTYLVETSVFSFPENKLLWAGTTSSLNPTKIDKTIDEVIYTIKTELQSKGLFPKTGK
ncbi:MAG TPA: hypothetical protein VN249_09085 [Prolixibacteraceae bacterium]|nr:hypothetical protein [Prolixibacteraceae bacterium]